MKKFEVFSWKYILIYGIPCGISLAFLAVQFLNIQARTADLYDLSTTGFLIFFAAMCWLNFVVFNKRNSFSKDIEGYISTGTYHISSGIPIILGKAATVAPNTYFAETNTLVNRVINFWDVRYSLAHGIDAKTKLKLNDIAIVFDQQLARYYQSSWLNRVSGVSNYVYIAPKVYTEWGLTMKDIWYKLGLIIVMRLYKVNADDASDIIKSHKF